MNLYYGQLPLCECIRPRSSTSIACHNEYHYNDCDSPPAAKRMKTPLCHIITSCCYNDCSSPPAAKRRKASLYHIITSYHYHNRNSPPAAKRRKASLYHIISLHVVIMAVKAPLLHREGKPHYIISYHIITSYHYHNRNPPRCKEKESPPTTKMISQVQLCWPPTRLLANGVHAHHPMCMVCMSDLCMHIMWCASLMCRVCMHIIWYVP